MDPHITDAEMEIMQIIWASGAPVTSKELQARLSRKKLSTIVTLAGRLIDKGILKSVKIGRTHAHEYSACLSEAEYRRRQTKDFVASVHKGSAKSLLSALFQEEGLTKEEVEELRRFLERQVEEQ